MPVMSQWYSCAEVIVVIITPPISRGDIRALCNGVRVLSEAHDVEAVICDVGNVVAPDASAVDALARLELTARRCGCRVILCNACRDLTSLLALTGLDDVVGAANIE
jgi:hypothetical protein